MDMLSIALAIFFLIVAYILFDKYISKDVGKEGYDEQQIVSADPSVVKTGQVSGYGSGRPDIAVTDPAVPDKNIKEVVYTQDYYPWWRSTRWYNYDGWLYQKP